MLHALAVALAVAAVGCMVVATAGMVTNRQRPRTGWLLRALAVVCFAAAVALNIATH
jgi:drug/metabolite transporter (DMT)-like permease